MEFCQSCGMPMQEGLYGTEKDGSLSKDYCHYCYDKGEFKSEMTMQEMIAFCTPIMAKEGKMTEEEATQKMEVFFPTLKRWQ